MWSSKDISDFILGSETVAGSRPNLWLSLTLTLGSVVFCLYYTLRADSKVKERVGKFLGPKTLPIVGNAFSFVAPTHKMIGIVKFWMETYGTVVRGWLGNRPYIFVADPNVVEKVLSSSIHIEKSLEYKYLMTWLGTGLLISKGKKWHERRKLLTPAFHFRILENFVEVFNEQSSTMVQILREKALTGETFNIYPYVTRCALDIICETAMGERIEAQRDSESDYVRAVYEITELAVLRMTRPWLRSNLIWNFLNGKTEKRLLRILHGFTEEVIRKRKSERKENHSEVVEQSTEGSIYGQRRRKAFLDLLLDASDNGRLLSDLDIREETDTFTFEGHDTTAGSISFTIFLLASYPDCQRRVHEELETIFGEDRDRPITSSDLSQMKYLDCCVKESLRLYPSVPFFARELNQELELGDGRTFPKGATIFICSFLLHRRPELYPDPDRFSPERFYPENFTGRHPYSYIPFSAGPRNCIGQKFAVMEEKLVLAQFFRNFRVEARERLTEVKLLPEVILRPKNGLLVKITSL